MGRSIGQGRGRRRDRKSTRLNSSHITTSYAVFCLKKKIAYVGSFQAVYGTSYSTMVATKALLFGLLLFLGALNFQLVRRGPASFFFFKLYGYRRDLHSFPTRRSSD